MRLTTIHTPNGIRAARVEPEGYVDLDAVDLTSVLCRDDWRTYTPTHAGTVYPRTNTTLAPVVSSSGKILCVGLNYRSHILEMGRDLPLHPTLFAKFADALIGPNDDIILAPESDAIDWEAELVIVIGDTVRRADQAAAAAAIAGFTVMNDVSMRDWQFRTKEWLQGKTFEATTPIGPVMVTPDELPGGVSPALAISTTINGEVMQKADTSDLVFTPVDLVRYASTIATLRPGDIIATGTPGGVGHARKPPRYLNHGDLVVTEIEHIGRLENIASAP